MQLCREKLVLKRMLLGPPTCHAHARARARAGRSQLPPPKTVRDPRVCVTCGLWAHVHADVACPAQDTRAADVHQPGRPQMARAGDPPHVLSSCWLPVRPGSGWC